MMNTNFEHGSATIYQFPVGGRDALRGHRATASQSTEAVPGTSYGEAWYHDEAIREAEQAKKN